MGDVLGKTVSSALPLCDYGSGRCGLRSSISRTLIDLTNLWHKPDQLKSTRPGRKASTSRFRGSTESRMNRAYGPEGTPPALLFGLGPFPVASCHAILAYSRKRSNSLLASFFE